MNVTAKIYPRDYTTFVNSMKNIDISQATLYNTHGFRE